MNALTTIKRRAQRLWEQSPQQNVERVLKRVRPTTPTPWREGKHAQWGRLVQYQQLLERAAHNAGRPIEWSKKRVLEVGAGPAMGFAPLLVLQGAEVTIVEPGFFDPRSDTRFDEEFLRPIFVLHGFAVGTALTESEHRAAVGRVQVIQEPLERAPIRGDRDFDVVLSKSCLEHIADLPTAMRAAAAHAKPDAVHVHYVDFSMHHQRTPSSNDVMYTRAKRDNPEHQSGLINLLRASEMRRMFDELFADVRFTTLETAPVPAALHADWRGYAADDLAVQNGIFVATRRR